MDVMFDQPDPFRPPDIRWQRVQYLIHTNQLAADRDDQWTRWALRYALKLNRCKTIRQRQSFAEREPLYEAHRIYETSPLVRWQIEGLLLAGETVECIAQKTKLVVPTVTVFHAVFFDVMDDLNCADHIANIIVGPTRFEPFEKMDLQTLYRLFGFIGGTQAVDWLMRFKGNPFERKLPFEAMDPVVAEIVRNRRLRDLAVSVRCSADTFNPARLKQIFQAVNAKMEPGLVRIFSAVQREFNKIQENCREKRTTANVKLA